MPHKGYYPQFPNYTPRPGGAEYRTVSVDKADALIRDGWALSQRGLFTIQLWRPRNPSER